jgi:hypothetical protein
LLTIWELEAKNECGNEDPEQLSLLRAAALTRLERVDPCELAKHTDLLINTLGDKGRLIRVREAAMDVLHLLPAAALAPYTQLLLQALRQPDEGGGSSAMRIRMLAADVLGDPEMPILAGPTTSERSARAPRSKLRSMPVNPCTLSKPRIAREAPPEQRERAEDTGSSENGIYARVVSIETSPGAASTTA